MSIQTTLNTINAQKKIPVAYGTFREKQEAPFIVYRGAGQTNLPADDAFYHSEPDYQIELYFRKKDEALEAAIEKILMADGWLYEKSSDTYIEEERMWVIYYQV